MTRLVRRGSGIERLTTRAWAVRNADYGLVGPPTAPKLIEHEWWRKRNKNLARPFRRNGKARTA